jgi:hypothetical protein
MQASKTPAYIALVAAVAAGALLSPHKNEVTTPSLPATATMAPEKTSPPPAVVPEKTTTWQDTALVWGNVLLKISAPLTVGKDPDCHTPTGDENEVGTCVGVVLGDSPIVWKISTVTQRDRFVPARWFVEARKDIRQSTPSDQLAARLKADGALTSSISLENPAIITASPLRDEIAIAGQAAYRPSQNVPPVIMTCVLAYILAANRPTQLFYCAPSPDAAMSDAARMVASIQRMNPSAELPRGSIQAIERAAYQKRLKRAGGAASNPTLVSDEIDYFATTKNDCQSYGAISQERFACYEQHAKARIDQMSSLP